MGGGDASSCDESSSDEDDTYDCDSPLRSAIANPIANTVGVVSLMLRGGGNKDFDVRTCASDVAPLRVDLNLFGHFIIGSPSVLAAVICAMVLLSDELKRDAGLILILMVFSLRSIGAFLCTFHKFCVASKCSS